MLRERRGGSRRKISLSIEEPRNVENESLMEHAERPELGTAGGWIRNTDGGRALEDDGCSLALADERQKRNRSSFFRFANERGRSSNLARAAL